MNNFLHFQQFVEISMRTVFCDDKIQLFCFVDIKTINNIRMLKFLMNFNLPLNQSSRLWLFKFLHIDNLDSKSLLKISDESCFVNNSSIALTQNICRTVLILSNFSFFDTLAVLNFKRLLNFNFW